MKDFIFFGSNITVDSDCNHEIKDILLLGRKAMTNLDSVLTRRSISLPTKVHETNTGIFIGRTEAEAPILWPPDVKS